MNKDLGNISDNTNFDEPLYTMIKNKLKWH